MNQSFWKDKTVFLTGHTGFKGGWIAHWLHELGASVHGYSLNPLSEPNFFAETQVQNCLTVSNIGDIRDIEGLTKALKTANPEIIIHMAAQPLVRESYKTPVETFATNVLGTVNILEIARKIGTPKAIINITTDKCYENKEWLWPYREVDRLGGRDIYSASKACAEIVAAAYRNSFLAEASIHLACARAGNVIGGGDWAADRLVPDFFRAFEKGKPLSVRFPDAIRPWQHVLEALSGYLLLAEKLYTEGSAFAEAWNFGSGDRDAKPVSWVVDQLCNGIPGAEWRAETAQHFHEAGLLKLDSTKANTKLGWSPRWDVETALKQTIEWHQAWRKKADMATFTRAQIQAYVNS